MTTADHKASEAAERQWIKAEKTAMVNATLSARVAEAWLKEHYMDLLYIIRLQGSTDTTEIVKKTKQFWRDLFRDEGESFPNIIQTWLIFLRDPKKPDSLNLFYFVRGVGQNFSGELEDDLSVEFRNAQTFSLGSFSSFAFPRVSKSFCTLCGQGMLVDLAPVLFHTRYRPKPKSPWI